MERDPTRSVQHRTRALARWVLAALLGLSLLRGQASAQEEDWYVRYEALGARTRESGAGAADQQASLLDFQAELLRWLESNEAAHSAGRALYNVSVALVDRCGVEDLGCRLGHLDHARRGADMEGMAAAASYVEYVRTVNLRDAGRLTASIDAANAALRHLPDSAYAPYLLLTKVEVLRDQGRFADALKTLDALSSLDRVPDDVLHVAGQIRITALLQLGLADRAAPLVASSWSAAKVLWQTGLDELDVASSGQILAAGKNVIFHRRVNEDHRGAEDLAREILADSRLFEHWPSERAELRLGRALALIDLDEGGGGDLELAVSELNAVLEDRGAQPHTKLRARLCLTGVHLRGGDSETALEHLRWAEAHMASAEPDPASRLPTKDWAKITVFRSELARLTGSDLAPHHTAVEAALDATLDSWKRLERRRGGYGFLHGRSHRELLGEMILVELLTAGEEAALGHLIRAQALASLARSLESGVPTLEEVRARLLTEDRGLLVYLPTPSCTHLFLVDSSSVTHVLLDDRDAIERVRSEYVATLRKPLPDDERSLALRVVAEQELAGQLAELLLPKESTHTWLSQRNGLGIVGQDLLNVVPFAWLATDASTRLGIDHAIDFPLSIPIGVALHRRHEAASDSAQRQWDVLLVGGAVPPTGGERTAPALPLSRRQALGLTSPYDSRRVRLLLADDATLNKITESVAGARVLQVLVHGFNHWDLEVSACLQLTPTADDDGCLSSETILGWSAPELVLLTACGTGQTPKRFGDAGSADLRGIFLSRGTATVLHSHSDLQFGNVLEMSKELHELIRGEGLSLAESLRRIRASRMEEDVALAPFSMGLLQVSGLGHRALFQPKAGAGSWKWWPALAAIAIAAGGAGLGRRRQRALRISRDDS